MEGAGESLTKSVSVPMAAAGTAAIKFASESQDAYKQFAAATGTATENLGKYQDMINNVYKDNFGESIGDVADAMAKVDQKGLRDIVSNSFGMLEALVKTPMNAVISIVNGAISRINSIHFTVPEWVPGIGGKGWKGLNVPQIPTLSKGTDNWQGGIVQISEKGGEIVDLPKGTRVYPHDTISFERR